MFVLNGRMSFFGGPHDHGVGPSEGLALLGHISDNPGVFLDYQPSGTSGLARRLDPTKHYIACRWDYARTPVEFLRKHTVRVVNVRTGAALFCWPVDWGPNSHTGRVADLSPGAAAQLGLETDDLCEVTVPEPRDHVVIEAAPARIAPDVSHLHGQSIVQPATPPPVADVHAPAPYAPIVVPPVHPHPQWPLQRDCMAFYGDPRNAGWLHTHTTDIDCPWPLFSDGVPVKHILIHKRCAESLTRVLQSVWNGVGHSLDQIRLLHYDQYSGSYNLRVMRGGAALSMHSYACAIDWYDKGNPFHSERHVFEDSDMLVKAFKAEGWVWGGDWGPGSVDAMHVQAARIHP